MYKFMKCLNDCPIGEKPDGGVYFFSGPTDLLTYQGSQDACYYTCSKCGGIWLYGTGISDNTDGTTPRQHSSIFLNKNQLYHLALIVGSKILIEAYESENIKCRKSSQ